ncbi:MAG: ABC transporter substrate-binding protein [Acidobacteriota bacterium]|nr:ABC transporter substrate-binding protein [Acidobacteriota bacterium]
MKKQWSVAGGRQWSVAIACCSLLTAYCLLLSGCAAPARSDGRVVVTFWHGMESGINNEILQAKIDDFNRRHSGIFIDAQVYGAADQLGPKLDAAVAGKTPPDLLWWAPAFFPKYAEAGALRSVDEFIAQDTQFNRDDVYDFLWEMGSFEGRIYATPFSANNLGVYYNKRMFAEAGLNQPPENWEQFADAALKLTRGESVRGFQVPIGSSEWTVWTWQCLLWQAGGELLTPDKRAAAFNSPAGVAALDYWRSLLKENSAVFSETDAGYKTDDFLAGRIAMTINGPWNYPLLKSQTAIEVGVFALPRQERAATNIGGESLFLFKSTPEKERAAWEFMKFVTSEDFQVDWAISTGYLPVSKSAANSARYQEFLHANPFMKTYNEQMPAGRTRPSVPQYPAVSATLGKYLAAALYDKYSSQEALDRAAREVNTLLK